MKKVKFLTTVSVIVLTLLFSACKHEVSNPPATYTVTIAPEIIHGTVSADKTTAQKDETVTLTVAPSDDYELDSISVKDADNNDIATTKLTEMSYTFVMPESNVTVSATFVKSAVEGSKVFIRGREITIRPTLWACDHEVTQAEYQAVMGSNPSYFTNNPAEGETQENRPVECVSWYDCLVYCNKRSMSEGLTPCYTIDGKTDPSDWGDVPTTSNATWDEAACDFDANGYRLPTEAEWEYLARGGNLTDEGQTDYSGSDTIENVAWYFDNSGGTTHEVKKKAKNALDLYDMSGNVWEWCWDWYGSISSDTPSVGASSGDCRVTRGGSWGDAENYCSVSYRSIDVPCNRSSGLGFRVVRSTN